MSATLDIDGGRGAQDTRERNAETAQARLGRSAVTEHVFMIGALIFIAATTLFVGYLVYRVHRKSDQIEGIIAAVYLQARRVLEQYRP
jgi:flagellar biogenesis protein FliO